ncbi:MAG TPA: glycoside hydrolase family 88 protein, partial [Vicinamibacterales bacterium]|nr:glycoside hydrolase family 88 protein [Vicinamibacterales bacterium]
KTTKDLENYLRMISAKAVDRAERVRTRIVRDPLTIAKLLAAKYPGEPSISYIPALSWANTLTLAAMTNDAALRAKVDRQIRPWMSGEKGLFGNRIQLTSVAGTLVFADLAKTGDEAARALAIKGADAASKVKEGDLYDYGGGWTDDMFMASVVLARTATLPGRADNIDLGAKMLIAYAGRLQRPDGLFNHATNGPAAWGRGNGFATLGLMEVLTAMPQNHPLRPKVLDIYRRHMEALRSRQAPDGMWNEVIDEPGSYREESATALIMTSMARGIRLGWLQPAVYAPVVERAWHGVAAHVAEDGTIIDVCTSTGSGPAKKYYLERTAIRGADDRGGAMALMAAMEMMER